jgi:hypothetical protein
MAAKDTHRERQNGAVIAALDVLAAHPFNEVLTAEEERGLATALPSLHAWATQAGVIDKPLSAWSKELMMRFLALAVRSAVPLRSLPDHEAFRRFSDEVPF